MSFTFTFNAEEAGLADGTSRIKTGGYYKGVITHAEIIPKEKGFTLEMEITNEAGESTGKQFLVLTTQAGLTVDKNSKILSGRSKLSALLALLGLKIMTSAMELVGKKTGFLGRMKKSHSDKEDKDFLNFEVLNFMDYKTDQTYTEKLKQQPPQRCNAVMIDDVLDNSNTGSNSTKTSQSAPPDDDSLPF